MATVEATLGLAGTEIMDLYPTTNKAKGALFKCIDNDNRQ